MGYEWVEEKVRIFADQNKKFVIVPMGKWGQTCRDILKNQLGKKDILCLDNHKSNNIDIFPLEGEDNWDPDAIYLVTVEDAKVCKEIVAQLRKHINPSQIVRLFSSDGLCEIYGRVHLDFLFVGFQKCGTSSLQDALIQNPNIYLPPNKETLFVSQMNSPIAHENFRQIYAESIGRNLSVGGIEPTYTKLANDVYHYFGPDIKILMCVRDPKEAAYSLFKMHMRISHKNTLYYMKKYGQISPDVFAEWVEKEDDKDDFKYINYVREYLKFFPKSSIKIIIFEDLINKTEKIMDEIQEFIGLSSEKRVKYKKIPHTNAGTIVPRNLASVYISKQIYWLVSTQTDIELQTEINNQWGRMDSILNVEYSEKMYNETAIKLNKYYKDSIYELEKFLNRSMKGLWY